MIDRRALLAGSLALAVPGAAGAQSPVARGAELRMLLDNVAANLKASGPDWGVAALQAFDPRGLAPDLKREYDAILNGLELESEIARRGAPDYALKLRLALGRPCDPSTEHRRALGEARALQARADTLLRSQGFAAGSVAERLRALAQDPRYLYADSDAGRDQAVADLNGWVAALRPRLPTAFGDLPIAQAFARRMSAEDAAKGRGGYRQVGADGAPGAYYVDLHDIRTRPRWTLPSVAYHELVPGHLLQLPLQARAAPHPLRLRFAEAYFEAWAVYVEQLVGELGAYADDPLGEIGALQWRLFRLARVVADTGLHAMAWSREQAIAAMTELQGQSIAFIAIEADVDRMIAAPAKVAAEGLLALDMVALRARTRAAGMSPPAFHRAVLDGGPWPYAQLAARVLAARS